MGSAVGTAIAGETQELVDEFAARLTRLNYAQTTRKTYLQTVRWSRSAPSTSSATSERAG